MDECCPKWEMVVHRRPAIGLESVSSDGTIAVVSSDFAFWKVGDCDPGVIFDGLADGDTEVLGPHRDVTGFRDELLKRWPDLADVLEPTEHDLREVPEDAAKYVLLTLPVRMLGRLDAIFDLARRYGLSGYSGVAERAFDQGLVHRARIWHAVLIEQDDSCRR